MQRWYFRPWKFRASISLMAEKEDPLVEEGPRQSPCQKIVRFFSFETTATAVKDSKYWKSLPLEEKRKEYKCREYRTLSDIPTWTEVPKEPSPKKQAMAEDDVLYHPSPDLNSKVSLWRGDITALEIDAIVNAANNSLMGGGGVDGAIHAAAGNSLNDECSDLNGCETGEAKITSGHRLPAKHIIHTVGPIYYDRSSQLESCASQLTSCYEQSLQLALENDIRSIAFPCISTGVYGFPSDRAAEIALDTTRKWLTENLDKMDRIIFCVFLQKDNSIYRQLLHKYFPLDKVALVKSTETPDNASSGEAVPTLQKSVTGPAGQMFHKQDEAKVIDDSKKEEEAVEDQEMDDKSKREETEEEGKTVQGQEMSKTDKDSSLPTQEEDMEEN